LLPAGTASVSGTLGGLTFVAMAANGAAAASAATMKDLERMKLSPILQWDQAERAVSA
jgi:hypothetical protein